MDKNIKNNSTNSLLVISDILGNKKTNLKQEKDKVRVESEQIIKSEQIQPIQIQIQPIQPVQPVQPVKVLDLEISTKEGTFWQNLSKMFGINTDNLFNKRNILICFIIFVIIIGICIIAYIINDLEDSKMDDLLDFRPVIHKPAYPKLE